MMLLLLIGSELVIRLFFQRSMSGRFEYGYHPTAGFEETSDGLVHLVRSGGRRFYPQTFSKERPPGTLRVMVFGDSVPQGPTLAGSYAGQLGEKLRSLGLKAESFNLAIGGNGAQRTQIILRKALEYHPSLVILHVDNGDEFEDERDFQRAEAFKSWQPKNWLMKSACLSRLYEFKTEQVFWRWVPAEVRVLTALNDTGTKGLAGKNPETRRRWDERTRKYTTESVALARASGATVLLLTEARMQRDNNGDFFLDDRGLDDWVPHLVGPGVYSLSMKEILKDKDYAPLFSDGTHLRPPGHALMTDVIVEKLRREAVLVSSPN